MVEQPNSHETSFLKNDVYEDINDQTTRIAIITTDYTENDPNRESIIKDVENIKRTLKALKFLDEKDKEDKPKYIMEINNKPRNVISKETSDHCTLKKPSKGYILMFNLASKIDGNTYKNNIKAGQSYYNRDFIHKFFQVNKLLAWSGKPKLIFNQNPLYKKTVAKQTTKAPNCQKDILREATMEYPIDADIFESFSNDGDEDSYGDENGSFYIQALCKTIMQCISEETTHNKYLKDIMCDVHQEIDRMLQNAKKGPQTPFYRSTHLKNFIFPK